MCIFIYMYIHFAAESAAEINIASQVFLQLK